jgi:hypothetical protein
MLGHMPLGNNVKLKRKEKGPSIRRLVGVGDGPKAPLPALLHPISLQKKQHKVLSMELNKESSHHEVEEFLPPHVS